MGLRAVLLAAGQGTRMKSAQPKVLYELAGRTLLDWVLAAIGPLDTDSVTVVVGHEAETVTAALPEWASAVVQVPQRGTGDAVGVALDRLGDVLDDADDVLVLPGDTPLITTTTLLSLLDLHRAEGADATLVSVDVDDPGGYGRIVRASDGSVVGVVEDRDATPEQLALTEINTSMYVFKAGPLRAALARVTADNDQQEYYLTDVIGLLASDGKPLAGLAAPEDEVRGVNSLDQLAAAAALARRRINLGWMQDGVWMLEPERVYIDAGVELEPGVRLYPGVHLEGETLVGAGAEIGPETHVRNSHIGEDAVVQYSVLDGAVVGPRATVGPYARLRPGAVLGAEAKVGTFVEIKKTVIGDRSKVPHLSYMGDATIGEDANIGAGSITCNYDGFQKHQTTIGDRAFVGSDTMLIAPVSIGDDAYTGAGSAIAKDVADGALGVERATQNEIAGYAARRKRRAEAREADER